MRKSSETFVKIDILPKELEAIRQCLENLFAVNNDLNLHKDRYAVFEVFKNDYAREMAIYILESLYDKVISVKISVFSEEIPKLKITQLELELLYLISKQITGADALVDSLKNETRWKYFDMALEKMLEPNKQALLNS